MHTSYALPHAPPSPNLQKHAIVSPNKCPSFVAISHAQPKTIVDSRSADVDDLHLVGGAIDWHFEYQEPFQNSISWEIEVGIWFGSSGHGKKGSGIQTNDSS